MKVVCPLYPFAEKIVETLRQSHETISIAESMTGGLFCFSITSIPGSSHVFMEGLVTYTIEAKSKRLGLSKKLLEKHGVISLFTAKAMAQNVKTTLNTDYGVSVTGNAGPDVNQIGSNVGNVFIGISNPDGTIVCKECEFSSKMERKEIQYQTVFIGLEFLWEQIQNNHKTLLREI